MEKNAKCACPTCHCLIKEGKAVIRNGKAFCSAACANDCTKTTCVCVHEGCDHDHHQK